MDPPPALAGLHQVERDKGTLATLLVRRRGDSCVLLSSERFAHSITAEESIYESVDAPLDAVAQRLEAHGDDDHGAEGCDPGLLHPRDEEKQGLQYRIRDGEHGCQHQRQRAVDEGAPDDELYVPQMVAEDRHADRQRYQESRKDNDGGADQIVEDLRDAGSGERENPADHEDYNKYHDIYREAPDNPLRLLFLDGS